MRNLVILLLTALAYAAPSHAQQCLNGPNEDPAQKTRRMAGLTLVRSINTAQLVEGMDKHGKFVQLGDLGVDPAKARAQGFSLQFTTDGKGYSLILKDVKDPCRFAFFTNEVGVIFQGYPVDYDIQPVAKGAAK